ncbi:MAG: M28 family peptidase [Bacteroidia bacterium]
MNKHFTAFLIILYAGCFQILPAQTTKDSVQIREIYDFALTRGECYGWLRYLSKEIGGRLSGSPEAEEAVQWSHRLMDSLGFDTVYLQPVMVPHWVRGEKEYAAILGEQESGNSEVPVTALGGSIRTEKDGLTAQVVEVMNFEELEQLGEANVKGKIVFYNRPMDPKNITTFSSYGGTVDQRWAGAAKAAKYGAAGVVVRSVGLRLDDFPHTGTMRYDEGVSKIPAVAISTNGAELLSSRLKNEPELKFHFRTSCETLPDALSYNVIGELRGAEFPDEIIVVSGHLDAWDNGEGAHDDGAGCVQSIEVLRIFQELDIKPKRTLRAVMFMNEENGLRGGLRYAAIADSLEENHIAAMESDRGGFTPRGFSIDAGDANFRKILSWKALLAPYGLHDLVKGGSGADIGPLKPQGPVLIGYLPDSQRYFDIHHAPSDVFEEVNKRELELGAAAMAAITYLIDQYGFEKESR